jgi:hypothetical protein
VKESVAKLISRLWSSVGPMETLSLNEARVRENFVSQLGAVESYTRAATKGVSLEAPFAKLGPAVSSEAGVTWGLGDSITQALILHHALDSQDSLYKLKDAQPGRYVLSSGIGSISRAGMLDDLHRERLNKHPGLYDALEAERAKQERIMHVTGGNKKEYLWLLTIDEGAGDDNSVCAATLEGATLRDPFRHWAYADSPWEFLGIVRRIYERKVAWLAPLHLYVKLEATPHVHS